jgi:hypothetical protein
MIWRLDGQELTALAPGETARESATPPEMPMRSPHISLFGTAKQSFDQLSHMALWR